MQSDDDEFTFDPTAKARQLEAVSKAAVASNEIQQSIVSSNLIEPAIASTTHVMGLTCDLDDPLTAKDARLAWETRNAFRARQFEEQVVARQLL